jgi:hypothetical protein
MPRPQLRLSDYRRFALYAGFTGGRQTALTWLTTYAASHLSAIFADKELNTVTLKMRVIPEAVRSRRRILVRRGSDGHGTMSIRALICQHDEIAIRQGLACSTRADVATALPDPMPWMAQLSKLHQRLSSPELA